jgi:hypothetical protein
LIQGSRLFLEGSLQRIQGVFDLSQTELDRREVQRRNALSSRSRRQLVKNRHGALKDSTARLGIRNRGKYPSISAASGKTRLQCGNGLFGLAGLN